MCGWTRKAVSLLMLTMFLASLLAVPGRAGAQSSADDSEFTDSDNPDDAFSDTGDSLGTAPVGEEEPGEGGYIEESQVPGKGVDLSGRQSQLRRGQEGRMLPMNLAWGAGTGLLIGAWLALLNAGDNRSNLQSIGTGIVVGALIGIAVGTRLTINPEAPVPLGAFNDSPAGGTTRTTPLVAFDSHGLTVGVLFEF